MKKVNLNDIPWRERKSPKGNYVIANNCPVDVWHYPDSNKWGMTLKNIGFFRMSGTSITTARNK